MGRPIRRMGHVEEQDPPWRVIGATSGWFAAFAANQPRSIAATRVELEGAAEVVV